MKTKPKIGSFADLEERSLIETLEARDVVFNSHLTMQERMPYQTLINSILHKAVNWTQVWQR